MIKVAANFIDLLLKSNNDYIKEKAKDIEDLAIRILNHLVLEKIEIPNVRNKIIISKELLISDLLKLYTEKAGGLILMEGGVTSHLSILARALRMPLIIAGDVRLLDLPGSTKIMIDAEIGNIFINPTEDIVLQFRKRNNARAQLKHDAVKLKPVTYTKDNVKIKVMINVNLLSDLKTAEKLPFDGIGLYRTEFPFLIRRDFPDEGEQYLIYKKLVDSVKGKEIIIRTLDIGGDKVLPYHDAIKEQNPFLGLRSIRFSLKNREIFKQQLKAILRAAYNAPVKIMFPMISSLEEFADAKDLLNECKDSLSKQGVPYNDNIPVGMMLEVPSIVELVEEFSSASDFFSIGSNDLIQYILAVDRTNEKVADSYISHHPAVLRAIHKIVTSSNKKGKEISICGDMANNRNYLRFLIGTGIRAISIEPDKFPMIQEEISGIDTVEAKHMVKDLLGLSRIRDIEKILFNLDPDSHNIKS